MSFPAKNITISEAFERCERMTSYTVQVRKDVRWYLGTDYVLNNDYDGLK
jgi:hypothetical protein